MNTEIDKPPMPFRDPRTCLRLWRTTLFLALQLGSCALAQSAPVSWNRPWHSSEEQQFVRDAIANHLYERPDSPLKTYSLAELIDRAESNNPETRVAWERARAQAARLGAGLVEFSPALADTAC